MNLHAFHVQFQQPACLGSGAVVLGYPKTEPAGCVSLTGRI